MRAEVAGKLCFNTSMKVGRCKEGDIQWLFLDQPGSKGTQSSSMAYQTLLDVNKRSMILTPCLDSEKNNMSGGF